MQLNLKYNEHAAYALEGAFIRGHSPAAWLRELDAWKIHLHSLVCFIIAQNNQPQEAAGLFVIFKQGHLPNLLQVMHPYRSVAGKLFLPIDAELTPEVSEQELKSLLIWDYQVFHPAHGFIGFEQTDRIDLTNLLHFTEPNAVNWEYADPGLPAYIRLHQIRVIPPSVEDMFESIRESVGSKSPEDIPGPDKEKKSALKDLTKAIRRALLTGSVHAINALMASGEGNRGSAAQMNEMNRQVTGGGVGGRRLPHKVDEQKMLKRLAKWMTQKLEDLQKQRESELKRLSNLFDTDVDEALQYAIPLSSPYFSRGTAEPSAQLTKRPTNFNLNRLGGGGPVDGWDVDNYYSDLRNKYVKAAEAAIEANDHKKAAYVYAHLLGDYSAAANVLKQGKYYREAAVLYKDHLNNIPAAAECLENGGLLPEAIEIYTSLNRYEKAGDLYTILEQREAALQCYEQCVEQAAANKDYLDESRILVDKIGDVPRAKKVLVNGWKDVKQPEACLSKYFDLVAGENQEQLNREVEAFYKSNNHSNNELSFLNVINNVSKKYKTSALENTCKTIAYEVVSSQVSEGNAASLHMLGNFIQGDRLLDPDCNRFIHGVKHTAKPKDVVTKFQLVKQAAWKHVITWRNEMLVWGTLPSCLYVARISLEGHIEYYTWKEAITYNTQLITVADADYSNRIFLLVDGIATTGTTLPANNYFNNEIVIEQPVCLPNDLIAVAVINHGSIVTLHNEKNGTFINLYVQGTLKRSNRCMFDKDTPFVLEPFAKEREMVFVQGYLYIVYDHCVFVIDIPGQVEKIQINSRVEKMTTIKSGDSLQIALATDRGCVILYSQPGQTKHSLGSAFAREIEVRDIKFISENYLAVASPYSVYVYELSKTSAITIFWKWESLEEIIAIFRAPKRNQLGILNRNGELTLHDISATD